jgi:hypothetical protein
MIKVGFDEVNFVHKAEDGNEEMFHFYRDENASPPPAEDLPQYLDDNVEVFDPTCAIVTNDFKSANNGGKFLSGRICLICGSSNFYFKFPHFQEMDGSRQFSRFGDPAVWGKIHHHTL